MQTIGYAAHAEKADLAPLSFERRELRANDVAMEILFCGVCHSDLHQARNDWGGAVYPLVPGHEIIGRITAIGSDVTRHKVGDYGAVGCVVDSCMECDQCARGEEIFCRHDVTQTYNSPDRVTQENSKGGYSKHIVVRDHFVLHVPETLDVAKAAPLLCAGLTSYVPLRMWQVGPGSRVGVIGLGGLGHMAVKLAKAMKAEVTVISRTDSKKQDALTLGADTLLVSSDEAAMASAASSFDLIIDTVPVKHDINPYIALLDVEGVLNIVGQIGPLPEVMTPGLIMGRRKIAGSPVGGMAETQEMLDFCGKHNILPDVEMIRMDEINTAFDRMEQADVRYRFVIDMASLSI
ncbi:NAD(P)-dependent alcohol dehydrogenase [Sphingomonas sp. AP4-R1]|uniref:NAD(P)-dependent alcohol dehydrogenase n=1 Tax=Sphingomonas sp. AP4-R1 TaxID=2735134 RepID=UPI001493DCDB|nr:NAD(P)-dependent alcohol dehydrogenase [Sphingomonas sp. AP4-R1]QJU58296.1 NAD(P)-dependent alcohol dehydrogenase [Sphingomonas sp. AP4-R1]